MRGLEIALHCESTGALACFFGFSVRIYCGLIPEDLSDIFEVGVVCFFGVGSLARTGDFSGVINPNGYFLLCVISEVSNRELAELSSATGDLFVVISVGIISGFD